MEDVTRKTIRTIETIETIKHNETVDKSETVQEQQFYLSRMDHEPQQAVLHHLNSDASKQALAIDLAEAGAARVQDLAADLLHLNDSGIVREGAGVLGAEAGHVHGVSFYLALLHSNDSAPHQHDSMTHNISYRSHGPPGGAMTGTIRGKL